MKEFSEYHQVPSPSFVDWKLKSSQDRPYECEVLRIEFQPTFFQKLKKRLFPDTKLKMVGDVFFTTENVFVTGDLVQIYTQWDATAAIPPVEQPVEAVIFIDYRTSNEYKAKILNPIPEDHIPGNRIRKIGSTFSL